MEKKIERSYEIAKDKYAQLDIDTNKVLEQLEKVSISLHCWQGDDVAGFETPDAELSGGGIQVTGNYPGRARTVAELRQDAEKAFSLIPGKHRFNLHAIYGEFGGKFVDRDEISPDHFKGWIDWANSLGIKLDFNPTCFSHPKANDGFTLSSKDKGIRDFWIEHVQRTREIAAFMGKELGSPAINNIWIPDGMKDIPADRLTHRKLLKESLDTIFRKSFPAFEMKDALESKLFGIGSESFVVGSHEFYLSYAVKNKKIVCFDLGHFHPTESIADKISSTLLFVDELLLHVSRGVRWDSDHTVILNDDVKAVAEEIVRADSLDRVHIALDFFDATLNRVGAWVLGTRATLKALLLALLEPRDMLKSAEEKGDFFERLALFEELKTMPFGAVWDYYCMKNNMPVGTSLIDEIHNYEKDVLSKRN
ncbi:L-rhamnose isomerase [candidate division KSB1 bacterium 4484_87]|nr:MAG: L-rhamnose isomerase [candidate division KSB1 bacterium 4484_87]